jgi:hypothetical protein
MKDMTVKGDQFFPAFASPSLRCKELKVFENKELSIILYLYEKYTADENLGFT